MALFIYSFITKEGEIRKESDEFESIEALYEHIDTIGGTLYKVFEVPSVLESIYKSIVIGKPKLKDISEFIRGVSVYLESGVSIQYALKDLGEGATNKAIKYAAFKMLKMLDEGYSLSSAMEEIGFFPKIVISMAKIGEASGELDRTLKDAADYLDRVIEIRSATKRALIYPTFSLLSIIGAFIFWIAYVLPKLVGLFTSEGMKLPLATRMLIWISNFFEAYWFVFVVVILAVIFTFPFLLKIKKFRYWVHYTLWRMPIVGMIIRYSQMAFYFQYLALLSAAGVTITESLETMESAITNDYFLKSVGKLSDKLREGEKLSESMKGLNVFEKIAIRMMMVGEETGNMDEQLDRLSRMYYDKVQAMVEVIGKLLEPIVLGFLGLMFIFFILALISPIYNMLGNMTK
ncbi:type II secretion system F family protein [Hippea alviniae]|uniref:type II secretion system F family protein n=1 Tax=Hippea alviniae TaxID=1279027 RepID=UPI0003B3E63B|nr:type II secretion system F family protein [Hippea alviniae]